MKVTSDMQFEFAQDKNILELWMIRKGYKFTYGEAWRTDEMQELYFKKGLSNVKTRGAHGHRLAQDYNIWVNGSLTYAKELLKPIGDFWKSLNTLNRWGGDFRVPNGEWDVGHIERRKQ